MPAKKKTNKIADIPEHLRKGMESIAKGLGVAVTELWTMFVMQYFWRGIAYAVLTLIPTTLIMMKYGPFFWESMWPWVAAIIIVVKGFSIYWAIMYIGNPKYYALNDLTSKLGDFVEKTKGDKEAEVSITKRLDTTYR